MKLPIHSVLPDVFLSLEKHPNLVLIAPPGAGKTTIVPVELFQHTNKSIIVLEPRRLAAKQVAKRMASLLGENIGDTVGYQIKGESKKSSNTKILVVTEGILTRFLQTDPELAQFDFVVFDEFHERHLNSDLALALCLQSQSYFRDDLSLIIMSATLDGESASQLANDAPVIKSEGRSFPVDIHYSPFPNQSNISQQHAHTAHCIMDAHAKHTGDILVFLPGQGEITKVASLLTEQLSDSNTQVHPLYGNLPFEAQGKAIKPSPAGQRKIVLATNIAETSLTIEGIEVVVDSGQMRSAIFSPSSGMNSLQLHSISQSSAIQRTGRAGRVQEGTCYRLYTESQFKQMPRSHVAEITRADLSNLALDLALWGVSDVEELAWLNLPPQASLAQARDVLLTIGAIDESNQITPYGKRISNTGLHPRLAHMLLQSENLGLQEEASILAALLSERDPFPSRYQDANMSLRVSAIQHGHPDVSNHLKKRVQQQANTYRKHLEKGSTTVQLDSPIGYLISLAYPDRVAKLQNIADKRYQFSSGKGARFYHDDMLLSQDWIAVATTQLHGSEATIQLASEVSLSDIEAHSPNLIQTQLRMAWNESKQAAHALEETTLGRIVIQSQKKSDVDKNTLQDLLIKFVQKNTLKDIHWDKKTRSLLDKLSILSQAKANGIAISIDYPDCSLPSLSKNIDQWLTPHLNQVTSLQQLNQQDFYGMFISYLGWDTLQKIENYLPSHIQVPSGSNIALDYSQYPPILPVRLQEMFGCESTPKLINNQLPVLIHLLSPAHRPVQITQDLASFWETTYFDVKKELKIKYKKHYWPDNPLEAVATNKVKSRM